MRNVVRTGNTPRQQQRGRASKKSTHHIASRVIGVEVHCGPVHGTLLYYTDDMSKGGRSTIIEVTRQGNGIHVLFILCVYYFWVECKQYTCHEEICMLLILYNICLMLSVICSSLGLATTASGS